MHSHMAAQAARVRKTIATTETGRVFNWARCIGEIANIEDDFREKSCEHSRNCPWRMAIGDGHIEFGTAHRVFPSNFDKRIGFERIQHFGYAMDAMLLCQVGMAVNALCPQFMITLPACLRHLPRDKQ